MNFAFDDFGYNVNHSEFLDHAMRQQDLWIATGAEIAAYFRSCEQARETS